MSGLTGCRPFDAKDRNRKSPALLYKADFFQPLSSRGRTLGMGTGFRDAAVFGCPSKFCQIERVRLIESRSKSISLHRSPINSPQRRPVEPAMSTISRSRDASSFSSAWNSADVSVSGSRRRLASIRKDELAFSTATSYMSLCNTIRTAWRFSELAQEAGRKTKDERAPQGFMNRLLNKVKLYEILDFHENPIQPVEVRGISK